MSKQKFGFGIADGLALLPVFLAIAFSSSQASAGTVIDLGTAQISGSVDATTCFDTVPCDENFNNKSGNESVETPYSAAKTTLNLSTVPSLTARAEADILKGGGTAPARFGGNSLAKVGLDYYFAVVGPQNITLPVHIQATESSSATGNFALNSGSDFGSYASLFIGGVGLNIQRIGSIDNFNSTGTPTGYTIDETDSLHTNTYYEVNMLIDASASTGFNSTVNAIAMTSLDPSFQIDNRSGLFDGYSIAYSSGIGAVATTPVPATLPLFASGLGILGMIGRRKRKA